MFRPPSGASHESTPIRVGRTIAFRTAHQNATLADRWCHCPSRKRQPRDDEAERRGHQALHPELLQRYPGQYVAICNAQLVDHDPDAVALLQRVRDTCPGQVILRRRVDPEPQRELHIRHPRLERLLVPPV